MHAIRMPNKTAIAAAHAIRAAAEQAEAAEDTNRAARLWRACAAFWEAAADRATTPSGRRLRRAMRDDALARVRALRKAR